MKNLIAGSLMASMLVAPAMAQDVSVYLNNERMVFDQNPIIENGRTLVPLRSIFEGLGAEVKWNPDIQEIKGITSDKEVILRVGETSAIVNGNTVTLDVPAKIENGRTLVPLRFISESLEAEVKWNAEEYKINIESTGYKKLKLRYNSNLIMVAKLKAERVLNSLEAGVGSGKVPLNKTNAEMIGLGNSNKKLLSSVDRKNPIIVSEIVGIDNLYFLPDAAFDLTDPLGNDIEQEKNYFRVIWSGTEKEGKIYILNSEAAMKNAGDENIIYTALEYNISNPVVYIN